MIDCGATGRDDRGRRVRERDDRADPPKEAYVPHNFIKTAPKTPNPGPWTHARVNEIAARHHGVLEHLWFDDPHDPTAAYVLIKDGDVDGLMADLNGQVLTRLYDGG
jgi:hypothetical protein